MSAVREQRKECADAGAGPCVILVDAAGPEQAGCEWFDPERWGDGARAVASGGRGSAWFLDTPAGPAVLRHYRRGGLVAGLLGDRYWWSREDSSRSFREFRLLAAMQGEGLPVPRPLAARVCRSGPWYRADLIVARIPQAKSLADRLSPAMAEVPWEQVGSLLARFHRAGVDHADLNAHNLLFDAEGELWLIDFDRGRRRTPAREWAVGNLERLKRSLRKLCPAGSEAMLELGLVRISTAWRQDFEGADR